MAFTDKQAKAKAQQIFDRFGQLIHDACVGSGVKESFLAGFTGVEAGIDRNGQIRPNATRFEPGVYHHLISVRDGLLHSYDNITAKDLAGMSDDAIRNLATSWGCTQIMGWHLVHNLKGTIADLRDINQHFHFTVALLKIVGGRYMRDGDLASVLHIWNTGHANGKTYHEDYVTNALKVAKFYEAIRVGTPFKTSDGAITTDASTADSTDKANGSASDEQVAAGSPPSGDIPSSSQEQPSTLSSDDAPTKPSFFSWDRWSPTFDKWQARVDKITSWRSSLNPLSESVSPISGASGTTIAGAHATGWPMIIKGFLTHDWFYLVPGLLVVLIGGVGVFIFAKRNAASRAAIVAPVQTTTVSVEK